MNMIAPAHLRAAPGEIQRPTIRIVILGHVDHGKSTLIGRILYETGSLSEGKLENLKTVSARRGMPFEWSFLLDALQIERDQGITIDTSQIRFHTSTRDFVLIDAPGHTEFMRNMITGAAQADAALLIVDATEGVREQTRRHGYLLHLLGIRQVAVVINKMDRIDYNPTQFHELEAEIISYLSVFGMSPIAVIPISARNGDGVAQLTNAIGWYHGLTVVETLDRFSPAQNALDLPFRLPVQAIYKFDDRRIVAGRIESGRIAVGDKITVLPSGQLARIKSLEAWPSSDDAPGPREASAGQSVGITLDHDLFIERGHLLALAAAPASVGRKIRARVFWLHPKSLEIGSQIIVCSGTTTARGTIVAIDHAVDPGQLATIETHDIKQNHVGEISIQLSQPITCDRYADNPATGRIVLDFDDRIAGGGLIIDIESDTAAPAVRSRPGTTAADVSHLTAEAARLSDLLLDLSPADRIARIRSEVGGKITFTTSFGLEDQVILHLLSEKNLDIDVVTLDTGRMFNETYDLWAESELRYDLRIHVFAPRYDELEGLIQRQGVNGFYKSRTAREACCYVRKVEPLNRALANSQAWITGLRADQSITRNKTTIVEVDLERRILKVNPLFDWTRDAVMSFAAANSVPINPLHAKGFSSIGCAPCTRAIAPGESERAGRWWWETDDMKECGLHTKS